MSKEATQAKPVKGDSSPGSPTSNAINIDAPKTLDEIQGPGSLGAREALGLDEDPRDILESLRSQETSETSFSPSVPPRKRGSKPKPKKDETDDNKDGDGSAAGQSSEGDSGEGSGDSQGDAGQGGDAGGADQAGGEGGQQDASGSAEGTAGEGQADSEGDTGDQSGQDDGTPAPPPEQKVKIGDREYTTSELEALLKQQQQQQPPPPPKQDPKPTEPEKPKELTEEEKAEIARKEQVFIEETAKQIQFTKISEQDMDAILEGGEAAASKMSELLAKQAAHVMLETRRGIYEDVNAYIGSLEERLNPVFSQQDQLQRVAVETQFLQSYPEFSENPNALAAARQVAEQLVTQFPEETSKMELPQFIQEVERQTSSWLNSQIKLWNPAFQGTWRDFQGQAQPASPQPPAQAQPASPQPPAQQRMAPPAPPAANPTQQKHMQRRRPPAPAANSPTSSAVVDPKGRDWQSETAKSLAD